MSERRKKVQKCNRRTIYSFKRINIILYRQTIALHMQKEFIIQITHWTSKCSLKSFKVSSMSYLILLCTVNGFLWTWGRTDVPWISEERNAWIMPKGFLIPYGRWHFSHLFLSNKKSCICYSRPYFLVLPPMPLLHLCESMATCFAMPKGAKSSLLEWTTIIKFNMHKHFKCAIILF